MPVGPDLRHLRQAGQSEVRMTVHDATVLALFGRYDRRTQREILQHQLGRGAGHERRTLSPRQNGESMGAWIRRLVGTGGDTDLDREADQELRQAARADIWACAVGAADYPELLLALPDPPPVLWGRGNPEVLDSFGVAIVGSRAASAHGLTMASRLARGMAGHGITVISGLARGIDSAAHEATLAGGGRTVAVLGSGLCRIYPPEHRALASRIESSGAVVTEYGCDAPPRAHQFPARNRIISGLARGVVIVEAPDKSGALITASCALEQGREVMVVPGTAANGSNRGGHALIRDGATLVDGVDHVLAEMAYSSQAPPASTPARDPHPLLAGLAAGAEWTVDEVSRLTGIAPSEVLAGLLQLELAGRIQRLGGGRFISSTGRVLT